MKENKIIKTENVSAGYRGRVVVDGVDIEVGVGEIVALIGPNGGGKSTLLKTIASQLETVSGTVFLQGEDLKSFSGREVARKMALVLTMHQKTEGMTCWDVASAGRYPYTGRMGILSAEDRKKVEDAMKLVHTFELRDMDFNAISDGQKQRVILARAICQEPSVIVLDEPTSYLDIKHKLELLSVLKDMAKNKKTAIVLSMHEVELAKKISDKVLCIKGGKIEKTGTPEDVLTEEYICHLYDISTVDYKNYFGN